MDRDINLVHSACFPRMRQGNKEDSRPCHLQGNGAYTGWLDKLVGFPSLALWNLANFDHLTTFYKVYTSSFYLNMKINLWNICFFLM